MSFKYQIGISYASEQERIASRIFKLLEKHNISVFFAPKNQSEFITRDLYDELMETYEFECKYIIAIISPEYMSKDYTKQELSVALNRNKNNGDHCLIPIYTTDIRYSEIEEDDYYFDYEKSKEPQIVGSIVKFLTKNQISKDINNFKIEDVSLLNVPRNFQIFISGATGVGKSTIARNLLNLIPEFVIIEEADMLREAVRGENNRIVNIISKYAATKGRSKAFSVDNLRSILEYETLKKSTIDLEYDEVNKQCQLILEPLEKVCYRLMDKGMPAIIEGVNLSFEAMFEKTESVYYTSLNSDYTLFFNLYVNNEDEHRNRLHQRCNDRRDNSETRHRYLQRLSNIRSMNDKQSLKAEEYSKKYKNVFNVDVTGSLEETINNILNIIKNSLS